jgi:flavodoxin
MKQEFTNNKQYDFGTDLMNQVGGAATGGVAGAVGSIMGLPGQALSNMLQRSQQQKMLEQQEAMNEKFANFSMGLQKGMWDYTNFENQVKHANAAGLNPAMLYAKGGPGGTTGSTPAPAGMGIASAGTGNANAIAAQEAAADIDLKKAQAENIRAQTPQTAESQKADIALKNQNTNTGKAQEALTEAQAQAERIKNSIQGETIDDQIASIRAGSTKIQQEGQQAVRNNFIDQATMNDKINTIHGQMIGQFIQNNLNKSQTNLNQQQQTESINRIAQQWKALNINQQNANTNEGQLKIQQFINDITHGQQELIKALSRLIPNIIM